MGFFEFGRNEKYPTAYSDQHSPAHIDVLTAGLILAFVILAISLFTLLPALNGSKRWIYFGRVVCSLIIGGIVVLGNYGPNWEVGEVGIVTPYKGGTDVEIKGSLGLHISLRGINITLKGKPKDVHAYKVLEHETIDYNENFSWEWAQGRFGFGYYAARIAREYRAAVYRGVPIPILQVAEYFTFDGEGIRFGRHYRQAGYFAHIMMWCAFPCWLISNILFCVLARYAAMFLTATGVFQIIAVSIWAYLRNFIELQIPFESKSDGEVILKTHFGPDFYLVLLNGIICVILGIIVLFFDACMPDEVCQFFGIDPLTTYDEYHLTHAEFEKEKKRRTDLEPGGLSAMEEGHPQSGYSLAPGVSTDEDVPRGGETNVVWRRRTGQSKFLPKSFKLKDRAAGFSPKKKPAPPPRPRQEQNIPEATELSVRTPLLRKPNQNKSSDTDDSDTDYANLPLPPPPVDYSPVVPRKR